MNICDTAPPFSSPSGSLKIPNKFIGVKGDKVISGIEHACNLQLHCIITLNGILNIERLSRAIRLTLDAEPILGCRFVKKKKRYLWQRREDLDDLQLCELTETDCPEKFLTRFLSCHHDPYNDLMVQAHVFRAKADTLCIRVNHIAADAGGVKEYVKLLSSFYSTLIGNPTFRAEPNLSGRRSYQQVTERFTFVEKVKITFLSLQRGFDNLYPKKNWTFPFLCPTSSTSPAFLIWKISAKKFWILKKVTKKYHVTINDILTSCVLRGLYHIIQPDSSTPLRIGITVDLRRYLPMQKGEAITNLAKMFFLNIGHDIGNSVLETLLFVHQHMEQRKKNYLGLEINKNAIFNIQWLPNSLVYALHRVIGQLNVLVGPKGTPPWFTNMGRIAQQDVTFGEIETIDAFMTPPVVYAPLLAIGATGFTDSITLSIGFSKKLHEEQKIHDLFSAIEKEISNLSKLIKEE
jgi:NRPS condensation-like uncharacterized protein